jgi:hypothetical protein
MRDESGAPRTCYGEFEQGDMVRFTNNCPEVIRTSRKSFATDLTASPRTSVISLKLHFEPSSLRKPLESTSLKDHESFIINYF